MVPGNREVEATGCSGAGAGVEVEGGAENHVINERLEGFEILLLIEADRQAGHEAIAEERASGGRERSKARFASLVLTPLSNSFSNCSDKELQTKAIPKAASAPCAVVQLSKTDLRPSQVNGKRNDPPSLLEGNGEKVTSGDAVRKGKRFGTGKAMVPITPAKESVEAAREGEEAKGWLLLASSTA